MHGVCAERHVEHLHRDLLSGAGTAVLIRTSSLVIGAILLGLFRHFHANAGGAWDNAKKIVEVDMRQKGTDLHAASVVGDTVGDPFKDTSSVSLNPVIKFTTLFGLLAVEIAVTMPNQPVKTGIGLFFLAVALIFVYRSFYGMRIPEEN